MPIEVIILFFGGILGMGGIILVGQKMRYEYLRRSGSGEEPEQLSATVDSLTEQVTALQDQVAGLSERLDFTERLLSSPPEERGSSRGG